MGFENFYFIIMYIVPIYHFNKEIARVPKIVNQVSHAEIIIAPTKNIPVLNGMTTAVQ